MSKKTMRQKIEERDREENKSERRGFRKPEGPFYVLGYEVTKEIYYQHLRTFGTPNYVQLVPKHAIKRDAKGRIIDDGTTIKKEVKKAA